ncbi:hypothetical protein QOT17_021020 [Balamuthia mandrillaris]
MRRLTHGWGGSRRAQRSPPCGVSSLKRKFLLSLFAWLAVFIFCSYSASSYFSSIPSRRTRAPVYFNEGGEQCFSNTSVWYRIANAPIVHVEDGNYLGGATPKFLLHMGTLAPQAHASSHHPNETPFRALYKPQFRRLAGLTKDFKEKAINEVLAFHVDCAMGFRKTPPVTLKAVEASLIREASTPKTKSMLKARGLQLQEEGSLPGVAQFMAEGIVHYSPPQIYLSNWLVYLCRHVFPLGACESTTSLREYGDRDVFDFIIGNWDRPNNQFYTIEPISRETSLVFLDHNHLRSSEPAWSFRESSISQCKFFKKTYEMLKSFQAPSYMGKDMKNGVMLPNNKLSTVVFKSLITHEIEAAYPKGKSVPFSAAEMAFYFLTVDTKGGGKSSFFYNPTSFVTATFGPQNNIHAVPKPIKAYPDPKHQITTPEFEGFDEGWFATAVNINTWMESLDWRVNHLIDEIEYCVERFGQNYVFEQ